MQFFRPENLIYLWLVPAVFFFYAFAQKVWHKRIHRLVRDEGLLSKLIEGQRKNEWLVRAVLMTLAVLCMVLALARPQWGDEKRTAQRKGVDIIFLVDTSLSMLAEDIKPNRLEKAKFEIETFIRNLRGDRVGMVTFAGSGFLQTPLTLDHAAFLLFLDAVQVGFLPDPGTSLLQAVQLAIRAFPQKELKYKALILFSDGEDHEGGIEKIIEEAKQANVRIYCIGLGSKEGEPIPLRNEKGERSGFKKDRNGQMVLTRLNQPLLERLAKETGGVYLPATPGEKEVEVILKHLRGWGEQQFAEKMIVEREDQYQIFLILAFFLLLGEMLVRRKMKINGKNPALMACLAAFFLFSGFLETSQETVKKGNEHFENKRYQSAIESYRKVQVKNPDAPEVLYDLGTALYKVDALQESAQDLDASVKNAQDPKLKARALYNSGNAQYRLGNFEKAIEAYKKALELDPTDKDAKYNLEFLQKKKNQMDKKDQEQKKQDQKQDEKKEEQKKDQQQKQDQQQQQNQQQQDQKQQDQQQQNQNQDQQQQNQDQQQQNQNQDQQDQKDQQEQQQPKPQDPQDQNQQQKEQEQKEKEQQKQQQEQDQQQQEQEQKEQEEREKERQEQEKKEQEERQGQPKRPLQGQMSMDNALNLLDALKESEKELQDLRRPPVNKNPPPVEKDW
jgi:Ca-activated chloride channel family protein